MFQQASKWPACCVSSGSRRNLGFNIDERVEERLQDLKRAGESPRSALPGLNDVLFDDWQPSRFADWVRGHGKVESVPAPIGRRLRGEPPQSIDQLLNKLIAACWPMTPDYPLPHYQRTA